MPFYKVSKLSLFFFLWFNLVISQNYPSKNYTAANELPNNAVRSLLIDSSNILWIGTENGVIKKQNDEFQYFFEEDGLALNSCWAIAEDKNNNLWFGSYGEGLSFYDRFRFKVISEKDGLVHNEITKLFSYGDNLYVGTSNGVSVVDVNNFYVFPSETPPGKELFRVRDFFRYNDQIYAVTYRSGVYKVNLTKDRVELLMVHDQEFIYSAFVDNDSIYTSNKGYFTKHLLDDLVRKKGILSEKQLGHSIIWDYVKTNDDKIFAAAWGIYDTNGGIYEVKDDRMVSRAMDFDIPSKEVLSLAYDPTFEKLYAGTKDAGLFEVALNPQIKFHEIKGKDVLGFARSKNSFGVLLSNAIFLKEAGKEHIITLAQLKAWQEYYIQNTDLPLPKHEDDFYELDYTTKAEEISFYDIKALESNYWINTNIGIFAITESGELHRYIPVHSEEINFTSDGKLIETNPYGGVRIYSDLETFEYIHFDQEAPQTPTMVVGSCRQAKKTYFLSIFSGLYVWENNGFKSYLKSGTWKEKKLKHITPFGENLAISNEFGDIFIVRDKNLFVILEKIPRANIQGNSITFLKEYEGNLIIGTEKGLTLYNKGRYIFIDKEQGLERPLLSAEVNKNMLYIGSQNGFYLVDLDAITDTKALVEQVNIKEVFINNDPVSVEVFSKEEMRDLAYDENTILLKFTTNAHPYPHKLKYQYRVNSAEKWSTPSSKPEIFLPFLPIDDYHLEVKVFDESTGSSYTQPLLKMSILPPFWKTWWFAVLVMTLILVGVYLIYRFQIGQLRKFEEQKRLIQKRFEETKMEALLAQMNPHFIFNAMNSIQYYIMDSDIDNATVFLGDFAKLIRLNLDHCNRSTILLSEEIEYLKSYIRVENTRFNNTITVITETDPSIDTYEVEIPTMLLQTFVENVFVHAFPSSIKDPVLKISFRILSVGILQCRIEDNGIGFTKDSTNKLHQSKGVNLVKERLALLGYDVEEAIRIESVKSKGTTVTLNLHV